MYQRQILWVPPRRTPPNKALGLRIKQLRATLGVTQEELADRSGMFRTYVSRIESGAANPTVTMLYAVAEALGVRVQDLFDEASGVPERVRSRKPISRGRVDR